MSFRFDLGPRAPCSLEVLTDTRLLVQANSGGGKSWLLRRILEQTHGRIQQLVIDPEGEFSTLRETGDYVLAARQHGDTVADPRSAKLMAERLLELGVSAILDIYELKAHDRIRFVRYFLEALVDARKDLWHPALVVVDEAHIFCPEKGDAESAAAVVDLATRGRKRGFCAILATQRLSKLKKDAAAECNNKLIGRTTLDLDMKRAADELGLVGRDDIQQLRNLQPGEFFAFGPAIAAAVTRVRIGPVRTSHPKAGSRLAFTPPPPTAKVKAMLPKLADLPAEAEERARTVQELQKELAATRRELTVARRGVPTAPAKEKIVEKRVEVPALKDAQLARLEKAIGGLESLPGRLTAAVEPVVTVARDLLVAIRQIPRNGAAMTAHSSGRLSRPSPPPATTSPIPDRKRVTQPVAPAEGLTGTQQRVLDALAWWARLGIQEPTKVQVGMIAGYRVGKAVGGTYGNILGALRSAGLIDYPRQSLVGLTEAGRAVARVPDIEPTPEGIQRAVFARLSGTEQRVLQVLVDSYPSALPKQEVGARAGYTVGPAVGGTFGNILGRLRTLQLIDYPGPGQAVANPVLFLES